jgi:hypothetical protein
MSEVFYTLTMIALKLSLASFFLRIIVEQWQRRFVYVVAIICTSYGIGYFFFACFHCGIWGNGEAYWLKRIEGRCASNAAILGTGYTFAIITAVSDFTLAMLPIPLVWKAQIRPREKLIVSGILALATVGSIASMVRIKWIPVLAQQNLAIWENVLLLGISSVIELGLGILAGSLCTLRPLLRKFKSHIYTFGSSRKSEYMSGSGVSADQLRVSKALKYSQRREQAEESSKRDVEKLQSATEGIDGPAPQGDDNGLSSLPY